MAELDAARGRRLEGVCRGHAGASAAHSPSPAAHGALWNVGAPIRAKLCQEPLRQPAHTRNLRWVGGALVSELRPAAERDHRMDVRHYRARGRLAYSARRRTGNYAGTDRLFEDAG